jgi:hypothetical protein
MNELMTRSRHVVFVMESEYVKENLGSVLTKALTEVVLHVSEIKYDSELSSTPDPITLLADYLLEFKKLEKQAIESLEKRAETIGQ